LERLKRNDVEVRDARAKHRVTNPTVGHTTAAWNNALDDEPDNGEFAVGVAPDDKAPFVATRFVPDEAVWRSWVILGLSSGKVREDPRTSIGQNVSPLPR
jgi:hypothetical protein